MAIKTDELQRASAPKSTDTLLMASCTDTDASGTAQLSLADLGRFLVGQDNAVRTALYDKADAKAPEWHDLILGPTLIPLEEGALNAFCRDQGGRVTVNLQCTANTSAGYVSNETVVATLPMGYRPASAKIRFMTHDREDDSVDAVVITVSARGEIQVLASERQLLGPKTITAQFSFLAAE